MAVTDEPNVKEIAACPFCGGSKLELVTVSDETALGTHEIVRCTECYGEAPTDRWTARRQGGREEELRDAIAEKLANFDGNHWTPIFGWSMSDHDKQLYRDRADKVLAISKPQDGGVAK